MTDAGTSHDPTAQRAAGPAWRRFLPIAVIAIGAAAAYFALGDLLSFDTLVENRAALLEWRDQNFLFAALAFMAAYVLVVAFSIPGALWMTLGGGFLFGLWPGAGMIVAAATIGATAIFLAARTSLGEALRARAGPWLARMEAGVNENPASYMLILRLVPAVPFFVANLAPAFLGVSLRTFVWTTFVGIIPGTAVYTWVGAGLGEVIDAGGEPNLGIIFQPNVLGPLLGLALLAALPIVIKAVRGRRDGDVAAQGEAQ